MPNRNAAPQVGETTNIPLNMLIAASANVRQTAPDSGIGELAASIAAHGLLQNLTVRLVTPEEDGDRVKYEVIAGGRRLAALRKLAAGKQIAKSFPVPCVVRDPAEATELSLAENTVRVAMHPADQFAAFQVLAQQGLTEDQIAARFGISARTVAQRLRLAGVSPRLIEVYRQGGMTLEHLMAFAVSDDQEAQERVWNWNGFSVSLSQIRRKLMESLIPVSDGRVRFVGMAEYEAAGGAVQRDLFSDAEDGWIKDVPLLERLVAEKLSAAVQSAEAEGWKWVRAGADYVAMQRMRRLYPEPVELTEEEAARCDALASEWNQLATRGDGGDCLSAEDQARADAIDAELRELERKEDGAFTPEQKARAGAFVYLDREGELTVDGGYVRPEDETSAAEEPGFGEPEPPCNDTSETEAHPIAPERGAKPQPEPAAQIGDSLMAELHAHRTVAMQAMLAQSPDLALRVAALSLSIETIHKGIGYFGAFHNIRVTPPSLSAAPGIHETAAGRKLREIEDEWGKRLPGEQAELWDWILAQDAATIAGLITYCIARSVDAGTQDWTGRGAHSIQARLAGALGLDMQAWWKPTAETFFGKVTKATILKVVAEAAGEDAARRISGLKKDAMAQAAEELLSGGNWLPTILRLPAPTIGGAA